MAINAWTHDTPFEPGTIIRAGAMNTKLDGIATTLGELATLSNSFNVQLPGNFTGDPVIPNTASYANSLLYINTNGDMALYSKDAFDQSVQDAANSAAASLQSANDSQTSANASEASKVLSSRYANDPVGIEVETGKYSSYHWSERSRLWANEAVDVTVANGEFSAYHWSRKAFAWSETAQGVEVEPGRFSAKHWALTAEQYAQTTAGSIIFSGYFDASLGTYPVTDDNNRMWKITVAGTLGGVDYEIGDSLVYYFADDTFFKIDSIDKVMSVNGKQGAVVLDAADVGAVASASVTSYSLTLLGHSTATAWRSGLGLAAAATRGVGTATGQLVPYESFSNGAFTDVGTAATRDVGTASGNVAEYTANGLSGFGYGGSNASDLSNLNSQTEKAGWFGFLPPTTGKPSALSGGGYVQYMWNSYGNPAELVISGFADDEPDDVPRMFLRRYVAGQSAWSVYAEMWNNKNLPSPMTTDTNQSITGVKTHNNNGAVGLVLNTRVKVDVNGNYIDFDQDGSGRDSQTWSIDGTKYVRLFQNSNGHLEWQNVAAGTRAFFFDGDVYANNYYPWSSDQRLKNKLRPVVINYRQAAALQSWVFQWKDLKAVPESQRGKLEIGLMAQDILKVFPPTDYPSLVIKKDNGYYTIDPDKILMMRVFAKVEPRVVTWWKDLCFWLSGKIGGK